MSIVNLGAKTFGEASPAKWQQVSEATRDILTDAAHTAVLWRNPTEYDMDKIQRFELKPGGGIPPGEGAATDGGGGVGAIPHLGLAACPSLRSSATGAIEKLPLTPRFSEPGCMSRTLGGSHARRSIRFLPAQDPRRARELEMIELAQAYEDYSSAEAHHRRLSLAASHAGSVTSRAGVSIGGIPMGGQAAPLETMRSEVWP